MGQEGSLQDWEAHLPVVSPYDQGSVGFAAIPEREILDPYTSFTVILFGGV